MYPSKHGELIPQKRRRQLQDSVADALAGTHCGAAEQHHAASALPRAAETADPEVMTVEDDEVVVIESNGAKGKPPGDPTAGGSECPEVGNSPAATGNQAMNRGLLYHEIDYMTAHLQLEGLPGPSEVTRQEQLLREMMRCESDSSMPPWGLLLRPKTLKPRWSLVLDIEWTFGYSVTVAHLSQYQPPSLEEADSLLPVRRLVRRVGAIADRHQSSYSVPQRLLWGLFTVLVRLAKPLAHREFVIRTPDHIAHTVLFDRTWWPDLSDQIHSHLFFFVRTPPRYGWGTRDYKSKESYSPLLTPSREMRNSIDSGGFHELPGEGMEDELYSAAELANQLRGERNGGASVYGVEEDGGHFVYEPPILPPPHWTPPPPPPPRQIPPPRARRPPPRLRHQQ